MITFERALEIIDQKIRNISYPEEPRNLYEPISYLLSLGGKRVRPAILLLGCNLFREEIEEAIDPALAYEIGHNFSLMHDDVMDQADVRRGNPSVHKKWDENTAILSGDAMLILSYKYMLRSPEHHLKSMVELFTRTIYEICAGQQYDMDFERSVEISEEDYIRMITLKTAVLIGACLQSGAIIGGAGKEDQENIYSFGINLGIAFQIRDDLLDVYGDPALFGKKIGGDILCNKKTYLLIQALNTAEGADKEELLRLLNTNERTQEKIDAVTAIYNRLKIKEKAEENIRVYYQKSIGALEAVSVAPERKRVLLDLARNLIARES